MGHQVGSVFGKQVNPQPAPDHPADGNTVIPDLIRKPVAIDGTQKFKRDWLWEEECLERAVRRQAVKWRKNEAGMYGYPVSH